MDSIANARELDSTGHYKEAATALQSSDPRRDTTATRLFRAELLTSLGDIDQALAIIQGLPRAGTLNEAEKSHAELILSRIATESGDLDAELRHLQRSITHAERAGERRQACTARMWLLGLVADLSGFGPASPIGAKLRADVSVLGEPVMTSALHVFIGELDAKRGLLAGASHHTRLAERLLQSSTHLRFQAWVHNNLSAIAILRCDLDKALANGAMALTIGERSGGVAALRSCLGNLGLVHLTRGNFELALEHLERAAKLARSTGEQVAGVYESMARVYLAQGKLEQSEELLGQIERWTQQPDGTGRYVHRHSLLTKAEVLARRHQWDESLACLEQVVTLARRADDEALGASARLIKAEVLMHLDRAGDAWNAIAEVVPAIAIHQPDMHALYERVAACLLAGTGDLESGRRHRDRAQSIYDGLHNAPALIELSRSWEEAVARPRPAQAQPGRPASARTAASLLQNVAALMMHAGRPELLARGLISVLAESQSASGAEAISRDEHGSEEILASFGTLDPGTERRTLALGTARSRAVEVRLQPLPDLESQATLNGVTFLLGAVREIEQARADREERLALWPMEELPAEGDDSVVTGRMQDLMSLARKVARANVTVLITGESGTGKEVLARAVHGYSARANKPFVPFNCTAVPRELLESHLFGYRRGSFTGADRDNPGLIRAAREGTLFLDEVGELGLDLQPKLLRFLESGEIHPLGDTTPLRVDVRVVAATNANLERMVEDGRFREDLFYRLNVISLQIPPLRERRDEIPALVHHFVGKATVEFGKGRMRVAEETMEHLLLFPWPGNVRQLQNELRRMVALAEPDTILAPSALSIPIRREAQPVARPASGTEIAVSLNDKLPSAISRIEREMIKAALRANHGRADATSKALGISRKGLYLKRQRLDV